MESSLYKGTLKKFLGVCSGYLRRFFDLFFLNSQILYMYLCGELLWLFSYERLLRILSHKVIYDIEDNVLMEQSSSLNPLTRFRGQGKLDI